MPRTAAKPFGKSRHDPLHVQLNNDELNAKYGRISQPGKRQKSRRTDADDDSGDVRVPLLPKVRNLIFE